MFLYDKRASIVGKVVEFKNPTVELNVRKIFKCGLSLADDSTAHACLQIKREYFVNEMCILF